MEKESKIINKNIILILIFTGLVLLIPLIAMQFTKEVNWTLFDFIFASILISGTGLTFEFISRKAPNIMYKAGLGLGLLGIFLLVWINGAVGILGNEENPANMMYLGVIAAGFLGSIIARFKPYGMSNVLFAMALTQAIVPIIAVIINKQEVNMGELKVFVLNAFFVILFVGSGLLFRQAGQSPKLSN